MAKTKKFKELVLSFFDVLFFGFDFRKHKRKGWKGAALDLIIDVLIVLVLVVLIRQFVFAPFRVHGPSMCDSFNVYDGECINGDGEFVITSRFSTYSIFGWTPGDVERGDVLIFQAPYSDDGEYFIKRVIGLPGDTVKIENGLVYVKSSDEDFVELDEPYLNDVNLGETYPHKVNSQSFEVPEDEYFVLGDNRTRSSDSRRCFQQLGCTSNDDSPFLSTELVQGEVKLVVFPLSHIRWISSVDYQSL